MNNETKIKEIFSFVFELPNDIDFSSIDIESITSWDSMKHVILIGALENEFDVFIDSKDGVKLTSYKKVVAYFD